MLLWGKPTMTCSFHAVMFVKALDSAKRLDKLMVIEIIY